MIVDVDLRVAVGKVTLDDGHQPLRRRLIGNDAGDGRNPALQSAQEGGAFNIAQRVVQSVDRGLGW